MNLATLVQATIAKGIPPSAVYLSASGEYAEPTLAYLQGSFYPWWSAPKPKPLSTWASKWECWQITNDYLAQAQRANDETIDSPAGSTALAVGRWDFKPDASRGLTAGVWHTIVAAFTDQGLIFLDPQSNILWSPTPSEYASTRLLLF